VASVLDHGESDYLKGIEKHQVIICLFAEGHELNVMVRNKEQSKGMEAAVT
jgi:hypothetical protein